ncbi:hypothetical protein PHYPSEUDO_001524 [Phytophthora pseudosyringae]|uniref:Uncharacterized protein n=1 Tax=Phytophthora pseudosyringae TaxID=221518 RepID=A0A8T1VVQ5_9STRA|nr:hypothetical protein PHYPSEUDO_001524 [Phytophthora pseudosyringae]
MKVWFQLVTRTGERLGPARRVKDLEAAADVADFEDALADTPEYKWLNGVDAADLKMYAEWGQAPLDEDSEIGSLGKSKKNALLVVVPKIWYQLFAAGTHTALTAAASVPVPDSSSVENFRYAVKANYNGSYLHGVDTSELKVYKNLQEYGGPAGDPLEDPMKSSKKLVGCGVDEEYSLIVEVPVSARTRTRGGSS